MSVYLRAGLYAEGSTDYAFLVPLLDRLLAELAARLLPSAHELAATAGIDAADAPASGGRERRIAMAIARTVDECTLYVIHSDGESDPNKHRQLKIDPGVQEARAITTQPFAAAPCLPVRETESWLLADLLPFQRRYGHGVSLSLPTDPEKEPDPKLSARKLMKQASKAAQLPTENQLGELMPLFGANVRLDPLRRLPSFCAFEAALLAAVREVAKQQGHLV